LRDSHRNPGLHEHRAEHLWMRVQQEIKPAFIDARNPGPLSFRVDALNHISGNVEHQVARLPFLDLPSGRTPRREVPRFRAANRPIR
jgi:hypothetical protein